MALRKRPIASGIATLLFSGYVSALGLGEIKLNSALNEPLDAEIPLSNLGDLSESDIIAGLASNADFVNAGVDKELVLTTLVFDLDMAAPGGPTLRILSKKPIREPYLDFLVDVQWPAGRVLREYTLLLDLPVYAGGNTSKKKIEQPAVSRPRTAAEGAYAQQPAPSRPQQPRQPVAPGNQEYVVQRGDTLWAIAKRMTADTGMSRRMDDILQINPDAFVNGDINMLKSGAVLRLPDYGVLAPQGADRGGYSAGAADQAPQLSGSGRLESAVLPEASSGRLTLEAGDDSGAGGSSMGAGDGSVSGVRGDISELQDELDKSHRENSELKQRLASLEGQIATMQKIVEIGDDDMRAVQMASQQQNLKAAEGTGTDTAVAGEEPGFSELSSEPATVEEDIDSPALALFPSANVSERKSVLNPGIGGDPGSSTAGEAPVDATAPEAVESPGFETSATAALDTEQATPAQPVAAPAKMELKTEKGWLDKVNGYLVILLGLIVVAIGAGVAVVLRKGKKRQADYQPPVEKYSPPPAKVRERTRTEPVVSTASSIDDIDLRVEDDLFAQPAPQPAPQPKVAKPASVAAAAPAAAVSAPAPAPAPVESLEDMELDLSEFDLDEGGDDVEFGEPPAAPVSRPDLNLDEEFDFLGDIDEGDTQLELAQAYIEMGDQAGAREILLEVAEGGSDEQKSRARQMLDQLG